MLSSLWKSWSGEDKEQGKLDAERLTQLVKSWPIGSKTSYYPEYLADINLETMILGYEVNDIQIYDRDRVSIPDGGAAQFHLVDSDESVSAANLNSFALIVPDTSELEKTLDYNSKAVIGRSGQFVRGNSITLVSPATDKGTPIIDTSVLRRTIVRQGYYQNYKVVALDPILHTLTHKEHRQKQRIELSLSCSILIPEDSQSGTDGTLIDYSESCIGVVLSQELPNDAVPSEGMPVRVNLPIPAMDRIVELSGEIYTVRSNGTLVIKLLGIRKTDNFENLTLVDRLDLRAGFAQLGQMS